MSRNADNQRIAKNTLLLYFRMLFTMAVSLYTSRVVLNALGVEDFGIYNVVGGIVVMLSFLNGAMAGATQRFLNIELGRKDEKQLKKVFSTSLIIHIGVSIVVLLLAETIGLWFLNTCMNISENRMHAANWVYQYSVAAFIVSVITVPYNATIIAHEKMSAFAYISILEVILKLAIVFILIVAPFDKLILYAFLIFLVGVIIRVVYGIYCKRYFLECKLIDWRPDKQLLKDMLSFSSWTIVGSLGYIFHTQGIAIIMNLFFGATVNAAQGIANQVNSVVKGFVSNFLQALNPQVVKTYAANEMKAMHKLVLRGCQISFYLVAFFAIPLMLEAPMILKIWLREVPEYTIIFVRLVLLLSLCDSFTTLLGTAKGATGKIKIYQMTLTAIGLFHLPFSALFFYLGYPPYYAMYVYLVIILILQLFRIFFVCNSIGLSKKLFFKQVVLRCGVVLVISICLPLYIHYIGTQSLGNSFLVGISSMISIAIMALLLGFAKDDRSKLLYKIFNKR